MNCKYVTISKFSELTGYTEQAVRNKMNNGVWLEGIHYQRPSDKKPLMDMEAYYTWVEESALQGLRQGKAA